MSLLTIIISAFTTHLRSREVRHSSSTIHSEASCDETGVYEWKVCWQKGFTSYVAAGFQLVLLHFGRQRLEACDQCFTSEVSRIIQSILPYSKHPLCSQPGTCFILSYPKHCLKCCEHHKCDPLQNCLRDLIMSVLSFGWTDPQRLSSLSWCPWWALTVCGIIISYQMLENADCGCSFDEKWCHTEEGARKTLNTVVCYLYLTGESRLCLVSADNVRLKQIPWIIILTFREDQNEWLWM